MSTDFSSESQFDLLSDYSFLERSVHEVYIWIWFLFHVWRCDQFAALKWHRIRSLELKSYVTIFILIALPLGSFYDIVSSKIKYTEGLYLFPNMKVRSKPESLWSDDNKIWVTPNYYTEMIGSSLQIGTLFLLQCFWNYLSNSIAKASFMSSFEFKLYIFCSLTSICIYPILQTIFLRNHLLREVVPQLVFASQLLIITILGIRTHFKFNKLIEDSSANRNVAHIIAKIRYFVDMNKVLTMTLFVMCASLFLLTIDLISTTRPINSSKLASDVLMAHINIASLIEWLVLILIFYPRKGFVGTTTAGNSIHINSTGRSSISLPQTKNGSTPGSGIGAPTSPADPYTDRFPEKDKSMPTTSNISRTSVVNVTSPLATTSVAPKPISESPIPLLKRNISISRDGKIAYSETKPLGKVRGSEFVAVEKADPSVIPYLIDKDGMRHPVPPLPRPQSPLSQQASAAPSDDTSVVIEPEPRKSSQQERMMVLQRQQEDYNALRMATTKLQRGPSAELERANGTQSVTTSSSVKSEEPRRNSEGTNYDTSIKEDAMLSNEHVEDEFFYAM